MQRGKIFTAVAWGLGGLFLCAAAAVGFANEFSFGKFFKRMEGMTPGAFRRSRFNPGQAP